jgi:hypothetical protein
MLRRRFRAAAGQDERAAQAIEVGGAGLRCRICKRERVVPFFVRHAPQYLHATCRSRVAFRGVKQFANEAFCVRL